MHMLHDAWSRVSSETMQNGWKKGEYTVLNETVDGEAAGGVEPEYEGEVALVL